MKALENLPDGTKFSLTMDKDTKAFVGTSATQFATECGIVIRNVCPLNFHKWESIPKDVKDQMYEKLQVRFNLLRTDKLFMEYVNTRLRNQWKRTRCDLSAHWKSKGGLTNPQYARSQMKSNCRSQEDWNHMCDYWELESTRKYSNQMKINRGKQIVTSRGGSRSIANHIFQMTNHETQVPPCPLEVYHKLHFNAKKQGWQNDDARIEYENIIRYKEEAMAKLISEGTNLTTTMEHEIEREAIKSVCAKEKTIKSAWEVGVGPVLRKKDYWMSLEAGSSQPPTSEAEALRNQVASLEEELKQSKDKYDKMSMFMSSKFPDFDRSVSTPTSTRATGSVEQINDSDNEGFGC